MCVHYVGLEGITMRCKETKLTFKYIWTNGLSKINKGLTLVGTKTSNNNKKNNNTTTTTSNACIPCLPTNIYV